MLSHSQTLRDSCKRNSHDNKIDALPVTETLKAHEIWGRPRGAISSINTSIHHQWAPVVRAGTAREIRKPMEEETEDKNYPLFALHHSPNNATYCCFSSKVFRAELKTWMVEICYFLQSWFPWLITAIFTKAKSCSLFFKSVLQSLLWIHPKK